MSTNQAISKSILADKYGISTQTLRVLMNDKYFKELTAVGYAREMKLLPPHVVRKFFELYGEPISDDEL